MSGRTTPLTPTFGGAFKLPEGLARRGSWRPTTAPQTRSKRTISILQETLIASRPQSAIGRRPSEVEVPKITPETDEIIDAIFKGRCKDLNLSPTQDRLARFRNLYLSSCRSAWFVLKQTGLAESAGVAIARKLANCPSYTLLDISGNNIKDTGSRALANILARNTVLTTILLRSNNIGPAGGAAIFSALVHNEHVTNIDLGGMSGINRNHIGVKGCKAIAECLRQNEVLFTLNLDENGIGVEGIEHLVTGLAMNRTLNGLNISSNNIGPEGAELLVEPLSSGALESLVMARNAIGDIGITALSQYFGRQKCVLTVLDVSENSIGPSGGFALAQGLRKNHSITLLDVRHNNLQEAGARSLALALRDSISLNTVLIGGNCIKNQGASDIADALRKSGTITKIDLSQNEIDDDGAVSIGRVCSTTNTLRWLDLSGNRIGTKGGVEIARAMAHCPPITWLSLNNNNLNDVVGEALVVALKKNLTVLTLQIELNSINYKSYCAVEEGLLRNARRIHTGQTERYKSLIDRLLIEEERLFDTDSQLESEKALRVRTETAVITTEEQLQSDMASRDLTVATLEAKIEHQRQERYNAGNELNAAIEGLQAYRTDADYKIGALSTKIDRARQQILALTSQQKRCVDEAIKVRAEGEQQIAHESVVLLHEEEAMAEAEKYCLQAEQELQLYIVQLKCAAGMAPSSLAATPRADPRPATAPAISAKKGRKAPRPATAATAGRPPTGKRSKKGKKGKKGQVSR